MPFETGKALKPGRVLNKVKVNVILAFVGKEKRRG
jgi:hypothetical protein